MIPPPDWLKQIGWRHLSTGLLGLRISSIDYWNKVNTPSSQLADALVANKTIRMYSIRFDFGKVTFSSEAMQPIADRHHI